MAPNVHGAPSAGLVQRPSTCVLSKDVVPELHLCLYNVSLCYTVVNTIETLHYTHSAYGNSAQMPSSVASSLLSFEREVNALPAMPIPTPVKTLCSVALTMFARLEMCLLGTELLALLILLCAVLSIQVSLTVVLLHFVAINVRIPPNLDAPLALKAPLRVSTCALVVLRWIQMAIAPYVVVLPPVLLPLRLAFLVLKTATPGSVPSNSCLNLTKRFILCQPLGCSHVLDMLLHTLAEIFPFALVSSVTTVPRKIIQELVAPLDAIGFARSA